MNSVITNPLNLTVNPPLYYPTYGGGGLYNGNITSWMQQVWGNHTGTPPYYEQEVGSTYRYDQLNRIDKNRFWIKDPLLGWTRPIADPVPYDETFTYDPNGNITTLLRTGMNSTGTPIINDNLTYTPNSDPLMNDMNQVNTVTDYASGVPLYPGDLITTQYKYNQIGQVVDEQSSTEHLIIAWTPYGKIDNIVELDGSGGFIGQHFYLYDGMGNQAQDLFAGMGPAVTYYNIYDGHNTKLATYQYVTLPPPPPVIYSDAMQINERYVYGSDRLATIFGTNTLSGSGATVVGPPGPMQKDYELHDHLGNVRATVYNISPGLSGVATGHQYYNYYAFGSFEPYRFLDPGTYPYGFNGKERKDDYRGVGNSYDYGFRNYDARIGRFMSVDPLSALYPDATAYGFALNTPIQSKDPDGNIVIFINGLHGGFWNNKADYWDGGNQIFMNLFEDRKAKYYDGSEGGMQGGNPLIASATYRAIGGWMQGTLDAASIVDNLARDSHDPNRIVETIKIVTHSMGAAYARGYVQALLEYADKNNLNISIAKEIDMAHYEGKYLPVSPRIGQVYFMVGDKDDKANGYNNSRYSRPGDAVLPTANNVHQVGTAKGTTHDLQDYIKTNYLKQIFPDFYKDFNIQLPNINLNIKMPVIQIDNLNIKPNINLDGVKDFFNQDWDGWGWHPDSK